MFKTFWCWNSVTLSHLWISFHHWYNRIMMARLCFPHWFRLVAQRCLSGRRQHYPSEAYIIKSEMDGACCPRVACLFCPSKVWGSCDPFPSSVQYSEQHADSMLITFIPLILCVSSCQLVHSIWMSISPPPFFPLLCAHWVTLCLILLFLFALVRNIGKPVGQCVFYNPWRPN